MSIKTLAAILLVGQFISVGFMVAVIKRQYELFKSRTYPELRKIRMALFCLSVVIISGNLIPATVSVLTVLDTVKRSTSHVNRLGLAYSLSNTLTLAASAIAIYSVYWLAAKILIIVEHDKEEALHNK